MARRHCYRWLDAIICEPRRPLFLCLDGNFASRRRLLFDATAYRAEHFVRMMEVRNKYITGHTYHEQASEFGFCFLEKDANARHEHTCDMSEWDL